MKTKVKKVMGVSSYIIISVVLIYTMSFTTSASAQRPINIGYTPPFTGPLAAFGTSYESPSVKLVIKEANAAGGINGRPINLFIYDSGSDPTKEMGNLQRLKEKDKVVAIIGPITSTCNQVAKAWADQNHIPVIGTSSTSDKLIHTEGKAWWFRPSCPSTYMVESAVKRLKKFGYKKVGYEGTVVAWGTDVLAAVKEMCPKYGIDLVGHVLCEVEGKDFTIQASKLRKTGPDAIIVCDMPPGQSVWARSLAQIGWKPFVLSIDAGSTENAMNISSPKYFEGWQAKSEIDRTKPYLIEVFDRVAAFTGKRYENEMVARAWDVAQIMVEAIRLSGNPDDPEAIRDGIYKIKNFTIAMGKKETTGSFEMGRNHMLGSDDMTFYEIRSGKFIVVD